MPEPHHDVTHHQPGDSDNTQDATVLPFPGKRWRVARIDTAPMTSQHYDQAVATLAALITQWKQDHPNANEIHKKSA